MNQEEKNGANLPPDLPPQMTDEEWDQYWAKIEAETPRRLSDEEWQVHLDLDWIHTDPEIQRLYSDRVVAAYKQKVLLVGDNVTDVMFEAERTSGIPANLIAVAQVLGPKSLFSPR
jgi:hypothetical protein